MLHLATRHRIYWIIIPVLILSGIQAVTGEPKPVKPETSVERLPVPSGAKVQEAESLLKEVLKDDYQKRTALERIALAKRLIQVAGESKADPNLYFASLREARDIAVSAGEIDLAWSACELLSQTFTIDEKEQKTAILMTLSRSGVSGEPALKIVQAGRELLDSFVSESQFEAAVKLLSPLEDLSRRTNDPESIRSFQSRAKEVRAQQTEWARVKPSIDKLKDNPADADAALAVGKYHILSSGDWQKALPVLATCASPALQLAAEKDLTSPSQPEGKADIGDLWWTAAEKETGLLKSALQQRALTWYQPALEGLASARKVKLEKRVQGALSSGNSVEGLKSAGLVFWINPAVDVSGMGRELLSAAAPKFVGAVPVVADDGIKAFKLNDTYPTYASTEPVKAVSKTGSAIVWFRMDKSVGTYNGLLFKGVAQAPKSGLGRTDFSIMGSGERIILFFNWPENEFPGVEGKTAFYSKRPIPLGKWAMVGATWDGSTISIYFNGERDMTYKSTLTPARHDDSIVGLGCDPAGANQGFIGLMGGAMVFNRALTELEIRQLYFKSGIQGK